MTDPKQETVEDVINNTECYISHDTHRRLRAALARDKAALMEVAGSIGADACDGMEAEHGPVYGQVLLCCQFREWAARIRKIAEGM